MLSKTLGLDKIYERMKVAIQDEHLKETGRRG